MRKVTEINLKGCVERRVEVRHFFGKTLKFITHYLDVESLETEPGEKIKHIRRTILFTKSNEGVNDHFCDIDIIDIGEKFLVTCCEHMHPKMEFKKGGRNLHFDNVFVSGDLKCFLLSKDDMYIAYLLQHMSPISQGAICTLWDSRIENVLLTSVSNLQEKIPYSKEFAVKQFIDIWNNEQIENATLKWNKHMVDIEPIVTKEDNVKKVIYRYDANMIPDIPLYKKEVIPDEGIAMLTILQGTTGVIFEGTPVSNVIASNETLPAGSQILIKNENHRVTIYLESIIKEQSSKIHICFEMTTDIRVSLYMPIGTVCDFQKHFFEKKVSVSSHQLYEIFKKVIREKFGAEDMLNVF